MFGEMIEKLGFVQGYPILKTFMTIVALLLISSLANADGPSANERNLAAKCDRVKSELAKLQRAYADLEPKIRQKLMKENGKEPSRSDLRFYTISALAEIDGLTALGWAGVSNNSEPVLTSYDPDVLGCFIYGQWMEQCNRSGETLHLRFSEVGADKRVRITGGIIHGPRSGDIGEHLGSWKIGSELDNNVVCVTTPRSRRCFDVYADIHGNSYLSRRGKIVIASRGFAANRENNFCGQYKKRVGAQQDGTPGEEVFGD